MRGFFPVRDKGINCGCRYYFLAKSFGDCNNARFKSCSPSVIFHGGNIMTARVMLQSLIEKFPGMYFQQIVRASSMPIGTVDYNLWKLQKDKAIKSEIIFGKKRFFEISFENPRMYGLLQEEIVRRIVKLITIGKHTNSAISKELKLSKSTISWYFK